MIVSVQAARVWQHPHAGALEQPRLRTDASILQHKSVAVGASAEKLERLRAVAGYLGGKAFAAGDEFGGIELVCRGGAAVDEVSDAVAGFQQLALLRRVQLPLSEAGAMERRPEAVARAREVEAAPVGAK